MLRDSWADGGSKSGENRPGHMDVFKREGKTKREKKGEKRVELNKNCPRR